MIEFFTILFTVVLAPTGIGLALDTIFTTPETKKRLIELLNGQNKLSKIDSLNNTFDIAIKSVFTHVFGERYLSIRFFTASCALSLTFLFSIILLQYVFYPEFFKDITFTTSNTTLWIMLIAGSLIIDFISFGQTYFIFQSLRTIKERSAIFIMILGDFIVTMNIFIILAPFIVVI